jgi:hypothetical protein
MPVIETNWIKLIGQRFRSESDARDNLPRRWIDLVRFLDEEERKRVAEGSKDRPDDGRQR